MGVVWLASDDELERVLLGDQNRALVAVEGSDPGIERPVIDAARHGRRKVRVRLDAETERMHLDRIVSALVRWKAVERTLGV